MEVSFFSPGPDGGISILTDINAARADVGFVTKGQVNEHFKYNFRGIDDALNYLGPVLQRHGITPVPVFSDHKFDIINYTKKNGNQLSIAMVTLSLELYFLSDKDASWIRYRTVGEGRDEGDDKATSKAMSQAFKYASFLGLMVPVAPDVLDESDNHPPGDEGMSAERASSALKKEDEGKNRSETFNKAKNAITEAGKAKDLERLKKLPQAVDNTAAFSTEEKAALKRLIAKHINEISEESANHRNTANSGRES